MQCPRRQRYRNLCSGLIAQSAQVNSVPLCRRVLQLPVQRTGVVTKDPSSGVLRTLSPTPYRGDQVSAITALWAPSGLGMLRDGQQQYRRIY